jgi:hypothetical protein
MQRITYPHDVIALWVVVHKRLEDINRLTVPVQPSQAQCHVHSMPLVMRLQEAHQSQDTQGLVQVPLETLLRNLHIMCSK